MHTKSGQVASLLLLTGLIPTTVFAKSGAIQLENGVDITPEVTLDYSHNDNLLFAETDELEAQETIVTTAATAELIRGRTEYVLSYESRWGFFDNSSTDDYDDHFLRFDIKTVASDNDELGASFFYQRLHERRGEGISQSFGADLPEPIEYDFAGVDVNWVYSISSERIWLESAFNYNEKSYQNQPDLTIGRDINTLKLQSALFWRTGKGSSVFINGSYTDFDYQGEDPNVLTRDSEEYRALLGIRWARGDLGAGSIGVGYQNKQFATDQREEFSGLSWSAGMEWNPFPRLKLSLDSTRASVEPPLDGDFIRQVLHIVESDYEISEQLMAGINFRYLDQTFFGIERNEDTTIYGVDLAYKFRSNIILTVYYNRQDKESSLAGFSYEQNVVGLQVKLGLK